MPDRIDRPEAIPKTMPAMMPKRTITARIWMIELRYCSSVMPLFPGTSVRLTGRAIATGPSASGTATRKVACVRAGASTSG